VVQNSSWCGNSALLSQQGSGRKLGTIEPAEQSIHQPPRPEQDTDRSDEVGQSLTLGGLRSALDLSFEVGPVHRNQ
jgi:hypothetical protein